MKACECLENLFSRAINGDGELYVQVGFNRFKITDLESMPDGTGLFRIEEDADNPDIDIDEPQDPLFAA